MSQKHAAAPPHGLLGLEAVHWLRKAEFLIKKCSELEFTECPEGVALGYAIAMAEPRVAAARDAAATYVNEGALRFATSARLPADPEPSDAAAPVEVAGKVAEHRPARARWTKSSEDGHEGGRPVEDVVSVGGYRHAPSTMSARRLG